MKMRAFVVVLLVAAMAVSSAVAAPPPGKGKPATTPSGHAPGKPPTTGPGCKPQITVVLKGTITGVSGGTLVMTVTQANRWGRAYATAGTGSLTVSTDTKVRRNGLKTPADLAAGDWVLVQARACKADLANSAMPTLVAVRVVAHPAKT